MNDIDRTNAAYWAMPCRETLEAHMKAKAVVVPEIGKVYDVPSGMGGTFTVRVLALYEAGAVTGSRILPARVHMRVISPLNKDWHNYTFEMDRAYFEANAKSA